jgi:hypothetical protein
MVPRNTTFFSCVFLVFLLLGLLEVGFKFSVGSAAEAGPNPSLPDLNGDGVIDMHDVAAGAHAFYSQAGNHNWNSAADLNYDGVVDMRDIAIIMKVFGKNCRVYDFNEPSSLNVSSGNWSIQNGILDGSSNRRGLIYANDATWRSCNPSAKVRITEDSVYKEVALAFCFDDLNNFYYAGIGCWGHRVSISKRVGGAWQELAFSGDIADIVRDVWYVLTVKVSGGTIVLYLDDSLELSVNDSTFVLGSVGISIWDSHVIVDYVTVIGTDVSRSMQANDQPALMGTDSVVATWLIQSNFWTYANMQIGTIQENGGNMLDILIENTDLDYGTPLGTYRNVLIDLRNSLHQRGMLVGLQPWSMDDHDWTDSDWRQFQIHVINNYNGLGDRWISEYANVVQTVQPDLMTVFSEAPGDLASGYASASFMQTYIDFCTRAIDAWRAVKPDLIIAVTGLPFWDLKPLVNAGGIPRSNVVYALHYYYSYSNEYPENFETAMLAYWNGRLSEARTLLWAHFLNDEGIQDAFDHGFKVWFEALGTHVGNPNAAVFCKDAVDFCNQYHIGYVTSGNTKIGGNGPAPNYPWSWMFNTDGTLNDCGRVMVENMRGSR